MTVLYMKIIALIPARGGSKSIPRKNIKEIYGKSLISYSIDQAFQSKKISDIYVSTEDPEISKISRKYGAKIINRPAELASDTAST